MDQFSQTVARIQAYQLRNGTDNTRQLLTALIYCAPGNQQRTVFCREVDSCDSDEQLYELKDKYYQGLIVPFRAAGTCTPHVTTHTSRDSHSDIKNNDTSVLERAQRNDTLARAQSVLRDRHRCMITGVVDDSVEGPVGADTAIGRTVAVHITPFHFTGGKAQLDEASLFWSLAYQYGGLALKEINEDMISSSLRNILTLSVEARDCFGRLKIWLEAIPDNENSYYLRKARTGYLLGHPDGKVITFATHSELALPDRRFIALHAACARILHMTGTAKAVDRLVDTWKNTTVLSEDGSSIDLLIHALHMAGVSVHTH